MIDFLKTHSRRLCQSAFFLFTLLVGCQFSLWVAPLLQGGLPTTSRPAAVDAFLPLSGLLNFKYLLASGEIHGAHPAALLILLAACASALIVKKGFCSFVCPVGFAGEIFQMAGARLGLAKRLPKWLDLPLRAIKYLLLAFFLWSIVIQMPGAVVERFLSSGFNLTSDIRMFLFFATPSVAAFGTLFALVGLPFLICGGWCRYLCPYGALLGLLSFLSPLKIHRQKEACIHCGACRKKCPSSIKVDSLTTVLSDECTGCLSCTSACPRPEALFLSTSATGPRVSAGFVALAMVAIFALTSAAGRISGNWKSNIKPRTLQMRMVMMKMKNER